MIHSKLKAFSVGVALVKSRLFSCYFPSFVGNKLGTVVSERGIYTLHQNSAPQFFPLQYSDPISINGYLAEKFVAAVLVL